MKQKLDTISKDEHLFIGDKQQSICLSLGSYGVSEIISHILKSLYIVFLYIDRQKINLFIAVYFLQLS